ncbi:MAG: translocation/assembly module TamB [Lachnoclostridium sp.]|nr:translocation/assembly module TamB [Lachnoclostridium sp.]
MKTLYRIIRLLVVFLLLLVPATIVLLYVTLSIPAVQNYIRDVTQTELTSLLGTSVAVGKVEIAPFNRVTISDVTINDDNGRNALTIRHLGAGVSLSDLFIRQKIVFSYAELIGFDISLYRDSVGSPLNIDPIINRLKGDGSDKDDKFTLAVTTVVIRHGSLSYDILSATVADSNRFDPQHLTLSNLRADIKIPAAGADKVDIEIKRLAATESSGLHLDNLRMNVAMDRQSATVADLAIDFGESRLAFNDIHLDFSPLAMPSEDLGSKSISIATLAGSHIYPADFSAFDPRLADITTGIDIQLDVEGPLNNLDINTFSLTATDSIASISTHGTIDNLLSGHPVISLHRLNISADGRKAVNVIRPFSRLSEPAERFLAACGHVSLLSDIDLAIAPFDMSIDGSVIMDAGTIDVDARIWKKSSSSPIDIDGHISSVNLNPSAAHESLARLTALTMELDTRLTIDGKDSKGQLTAEIPALTFDDNELGGINLIASVADRHLFAELSSSGEHLNFSSSGEIDFSSSVPLSTISGQFSAIDLSPFITRGKFSDTALSFDLNASVSGTSIDEFNGAVDITDLSAWNLDTGKRMSINKIAVECNDIDSIKTLSINSDILKASASGQFKFSTLATSVTDILSHVYPALIAAPDHKLMADNQIDTHIVLLPDSSLASYMDLPVRIVHPIDIAGFIDSENGLISLNVDAPYLLQKTKLIESSVISAFIDGNNTRSELMLTTVMPTKHGPLTLTLNSEGAINTAATDISWKVNREHDYHGNFRFDTSFEADTVDARKELVTSININPSTMIFNDTAWTVNPSEINIRPGLVSVNDFHAGREGQHIIIDGKASADSTDVIKLQLRDIDLDYVFETLNISNVMFGGNATGDFFASHLMSGNPVLYTDNLLVRHLSYNNCVMGDGQIRSAWHNDNQSVTIDADITQADGRHSIINGMIRPMAEELDFKFKADRAPVGFLKPFMSAFTSDVSGFATGDAHLYGTFKLIDMTGEILAEDLKMKLDFTNTVYSVRRDSVHITPGRIDFSDVKLYDVYDHEARLTGHVTHKCFKEPTFLFEITDAKDFLCYDINERTTTDPWYGRIFGNGGVTVKGWPGMVNIDVRMSTAPNSNFTFVISDAEQATEYNFITFRDRDKARKDSLAVADRLPLLIRRMHERAKVEEQGPPTDYVMNFTVDVNPSALLTLVMDPVGGDRIKAHGSGTMRMNYSSTGDLRMYGQYKIVSGSYNFTLQDIFLKDFTIVEGSSIEFNGDPYAATLNIKAAYAVNANLTDLDESFAQDKELNRTNVPVNALLLVTGDMRQPEIDFDIEFPTLTRDVDRKVRSIVSTKDMMNRQIIYLLALNRFYTPDYMNATRGNELVSVASSTISSRLSSMLGQLSDKWSIAPNFRSDRGDFSDVEVDVALSSHLLNNRLLLNGNFGYRDKSLNNNSFIGDFDIRYLLNRSGSIALKAYNRYNDQNYYLKSALTTQGVGIVFKRDFDNIFSFLRPVVRWWNQRKQTTNSSADDGDSEPAPQQTDSEIQE